MIKRKIKTADKTSFVIYGYTETRQCKECLYFKVERLAKDYNRCTKYFNRNGRHPHWKSSLPACGFFEGRDK